MITGNAKEVRVPLVIRGAGVGRGIAIGPLKFGPMRTKSRGLRIDSELLLLERAISWAKDELKKSEERAVKSVGDEHGEIFRLLLSELGGGEYLESVREYIKNGDTLCEAAMRVSQQFIKTAENDGKREAKARAARAKELTTILKEATENMVDSDTSNVPHMSGEDMKDTENTKYILVASDFDGFFRGRDDSGDIIGIVSVGGTEGTGLAAYAKAKGIPALVISASDVPSMHLEGSGAIIDPERGRLTVNPDLEALDKFTESSRASEENEERLAAFIGLPSVTRSGRYIPMLATVSEESGISSAISADAEGIYLPLADGKDHSCELYEKAIESFAGKNVIVGLCSPRDERGNFGVRYFLENRDVLKFELREILRGADRGELALAVSGAVYPEEIRRVRAVLVETASELKNEGVSYGERLRLGAIIDTPAAALCGELIASEVDLFVVDSDALSSLALDADRKFPTSADVVKRNPEPTLRLIEMAAKAIHSSGKGKLVGVSGDMAFDRSLTERLAGIGVDFMSVPPPYILEMRERIRECQE